MADKKKPSAKPRQTKSTRVLESVVVKPIKKAKPVVVTEAVAEKPVAGRSLLPVWIGMVVIIGLLLVVQYGKHMHWPQITINIPDLPDMPQMPDLPSLPDFSALLPEKTTESEAQDIPTPETLPLSQEKVADDSKETNALKQQLSDAEGKIQQLESIVQQKDKALQREIALRGQSLLAQYARLIEHALEKGLPFPWELEQLQHFSDGNMPEAASLVQALTPYAQGVASTQKLQENFKGISEEIYIRWKKEDETTGLSAMFRRMLHQIISIRRVGLVEGNTPEAIAARAEYYLNKGDVAQAIQELSVFEGSYASIVQPWLADAKLHLEAKKLIQELRTLAQKMTSGSALDAPNNKIDISDSPAEIEAP